MPRMNRPRVDAAFFRVWKEDADHVHRIRGHVVSAADDAPLDRGGDGAGPGIDAELRVDVREVRLHGRLGDEELLRHLAVAEALRQQLEYRDFAFGDDGAGGGRAAHERGRDRGREHRLTTGSRPDAGEQLGRGGILQQVTARPGVEGLQDVGLVGVRRELGQLAPCGLDTTRTPAEERAADRRQVERAALREGGVPAFMW